MTPELTIRVRWPDGYERTYDLTSYLLLSEEALAHTLTSLEYRRRDQDS